MKLRLYISPCPNDTFIFDAIVNGRIDTQGIEFDTHFEDIEQLNARAIRGEGDICKVSCAVLPLIEKHFTPLRSGAALGRGNGPLLVARQAVDVSAPQRVAIPGRYTTANMLMSKLFPHIVDKPDYLFSDVAAAVSRGECDAGVLIHEGRFTYAEKGLTLLADLGQLWEQQTALPLPLGIITASRALPPETISAVEKLIRQSIEYAFANPEASADFVRSHAQELSPEVTRQHIEMFVNQYSLDLGRDGEQALKALYESTVG